MRLFNIGIKVNNYRSSLKILLSAYACEPHKGSEAGVGWHWAVELSRLRHEVWVITRANNRTAIDAELAHNPHPNLHFIYYDLPDWAKSWKKRSTHNSKNQNIILAIEIIADRAILPCGSVTGPFDFVFLNS